MSAVARNPQASDAPALRTGMVAAVLLVSGALGLAASLTLAVEKHWLLTNPFYSPSCTLSETLSCTPVMTSWQAELLGFPNPYLGMVGFTVLAVTGGALLGGAQLASWYWGGLQLGAIIGTAFVIWLMYQSLVNIQALCPYCMLVWAAMFTAMWYVSLESMNRRAMKLPARVHPVVLFALRRHDLLLLSWFVVIALIITTSVVSFA